MKPGEVFYSELVPEGADFVRRDFSEDAWEGPDPEVIGWWKSQIPDPHSCQVHWAPNDVILHYFESLDGREDRADVRYVLALLMLRRRLVRHEDTESAAHGGEVWVLFCPRKEAEYRVRVVEPGAERIGEIQEELARLLFAKAA